MFEVNKELLESHEAELNVVVEEATVEEAKRRAAREISRHVNIPGFRRGKAPYSKVVQYVGESAVIQEAAESLLDRHYSEILDLAEISPYGPGEFVDMSTSPLTFIIRVPLEPEVNLGDYTEIREDWEDVTVSDEEIDQVLDQVRNEHAVLEPVERPAELGDEVVVDVHATVEDDVIVHEHDIEVVLSEERPFLSDVFVTTLMGMSAGDEKDVTLPLPETIEEPSLQGVDANFELKVTKVYARQLPELDDALASTVGSFETIEALVEDIRTRILDSKHQQSETEYRNTLVARLVEQAEIVYPPKMVEDTLDDIVEETEQQVQRQQQMPLEDALRLQGQTMEQFRELMTPQAKARVEQSLVLAKFAEVEGLDVTEDEVVNEFGTMMRQITQGSEFPQQRIEMESELGRSLRSSVLGRKVLERLSAIGRGQSFEDAAPETEAVDAETEADVDALDSQDAADSDLEADPEATSAETEVEASDLVADAIEDENGIDVEDETEGQPEAEA